MKGKYSLPLVLGRKACRGFESNCRFVNLEFITVLSDKDNLERDNQWSGMSTSMQSPRLVFDSMVKESVRQGLTFTLGASGFGVIQKRLDIETAATRPGQLHSLLVTIFQEPGATVLEREILRQLYELVGEQFVATPGFTFESYVEGARRADEQLRGRTG